MYRKLNWMLIDQIQINNTSLTSQVQTIVVVSNISPQSKCLAAAVYFHKKTVNKGRQNKCQW